MVLDFDLVVLFGVDTGRFNQAIKRNRNRFPAAWPFRHETPSHPTKQTPSPLV
jgi:hypothetical protein